MIYEGFALNDLVFSRAPDPAYRSAYPARGERIFRFNLQPEQDQKFPAFVNLQQFYVEQYLVEALARVAADALLSLEYEDVQDLRQGAGGRG